MHALSGIDAKPSKSGFLAPLLRSLRAYESPPGTVASAVRKTPPATSGDTPRSNTRLRLHVRTLWISDIHLGTRDCKADYLLDLLAHTDCKQIYLVGDIIDFWRLKSSCICSISSSSPCASDGDGQSRWPSRRARVSAGSRWRC